MCQNERFQCVNICQTADISTNTVMPTVHHLTAWGGSSLSKIHKGYHHHLMHESDHHYLMHEWSPSSDAQEWSPPSFARVITTIFWVIISLPKRDHSHCPIVIIISHCLRVTISFPGVIITISSPGVIITTSFPKVIIATSFMEVIIISIV